MPAVGSLQARLILAFVAVLFTALALSSAVFVFTTRGEQEQHEVDRVAAASPAVFASFSAGIVRGESFDQIAREAAAAYDVRVLVVDHEGLVAEDSSGVLEGKNIGDLPTLRQPAQAPRQNPNRGADGSVPIRADGTPMPGPRGGDPQGRGGTTDWLDRTWRPEEGSPAEGLVLVASGLPNVRWNVGDSRGPVFSADEGYSVVLAVSADTVTRAWLGLLPALAWAAAVALPVAILMAILLARYITRPVKQLTLASQRMADGVFDVDVPSGRHDELGQLSQSFATMAARVGESQSQMRALVANVSHDLKTPLTSILGFSRAIETGTARGPEETARLGGIIHEEAERLATRIGDLTFLSELDAANTLMDSDDIDLGRLVLGVGARIFAGEADRLSFDLAEDAIITGDAPRLERAVENLLDNARKYAPVESRIRVTVARTGADVTLSVTNPAPGLEAAEVPRLFERLYRRDRTRGTVDGSGLGLAIAREIIELHRGNLDASVSDDEITFIATLPAVTCETGL